MNYQGNHAKDDDDGLTVVGKHVIKVTFYKAVF